MSQDNNDTSAVKPVSPTDSTSKTKPKAAPKKTTSKPKAAPKKTTSKPKAAVKPKVIKTEKSVKSKSDYLSLRTQINKKRPAFRAQESWRYKRIDSRWRKPKGFDSFMRIQKKSWPAIVKIGYRGPKAVRGLHPSGYNDVLIYNIDSLKTLDPSVDAIRLSAKIGKRYRLLIINEADKLGFKVLNKGNLNRSK